MFHFICCWSAGSRGENSNSRTAQDQIQSSEPIALVDMQPLQPSQIRTSERLHKRRPEQFPSPHPHRQITNPFKSISPSKLNILPSLRKRSSRPNGVSADVEALYQEGREMLRMEEEANGNVSAENIVSSTRPQRALIRGPEFFASNEFNTDRSGLQVPIGNNGASADWMSTLNLDSPSQNERSPRITPSDYTAEVVIPIRRSSRG